MAFGQIAGHIVSGSGACKAHKKSRNSSVGRALDWRSKGLVFDPRLWQFANFFVHIPFHSLFFLLRLIPSLIFIGEHQTLVALVLPGPCSIHDLAIRKFFLSNHCDLLYSILQNNPNLTRDLFIMFNPQKKFTSENETGIGNFLR